MVSVCILYYSLITWKIVIVKIKIKQLNFAFNYLLFFCFSWSIPLYHIKLFKNQGTEDKSNENSRFFAIWRTTAFEPVRSAQAQGLLHGTAVFSAVWPQFVFWMRWCWIQQQLAQQCQFCRLHDPACLAKGLKQDALLRHLC